LPAPKDVFGPLGHQPGKLTYGLYVYHILGLQFGGMLVGWLQGRFPTALATGLSCRLPLTLSALERQRVCMVESPAERRATREAGT
jgi:hypothetical protein